MLFVACSLNLVGGVLAWQDWILSRLGGGGGGEAAARLEDVFTIEEVFVAVSNLNGGKAPSPYGFPLAFWQFSWDFVKEEVMSFFNDFFLA